MKISRNEGFAMAAIGIIAFLGYKLYKSDKALKDKKAELKALIKSKDQAEKIAAEKKAEEEKARLLEAVAASGKSIDEILEMLK